MIDVTINVTFTAAEAWQYAQFLKRVGLGDYQEKAMAQDEAYTMVAAGEKIREALRERGYSPR
jgi:hypothetical protein